MLFWWSYSIRSEMFNGVGIIVSMIVVRVSGMMAVVVGHDIWYVWSSPSIA